MLRVHLTAEDLLRTRFARHPAPLIEVGHTKTLRAAGLIATTRAGQAVQHLATPLGRALAHGGAAPATAPRPSL